MEGIRVAATVIFTVLPIVLLLGYFYTRDVRREPRATLAATFLLGVAIALPAVFLSLMLLVIPGRSLGLFDGALYDAFVVAAIPEELLKLAVIAWFCARRRTFDEAMDGVVYGATAALGFAAIENVLYVAQGGWIVALMRSVTAVPMHAAMGAILGYYVAQQRLLLRRGAMWSGLAIAVLVHGWYDFGPMVLVRLGADEESPAQMGFLSLGLVVLFLAVVVTTLLAVRRLVRRLRSGQLVSCASGTRDASGSRLADSSDPLVAHLLERRAQDAEASGATDGVCATGEADAGKAPCSEGLPSSDPLSPHDGDRLAA